MNALKLKCPWSLKLTVSLHFGSMTENFNLVTSRLTRVPLTIMPDSDAFLPGSSLSRAGLNLQSSPTNLQSWPT